MKLQQQGNQRRFMRWMVGMLLVAQCIPSRTHAFPFSKTVVVPQNPLVAFAKENPDVALVMSATVVAAIGYVIYQYFAQKSPISRLVAENLKPVQDDFDRVLSLQNADTKFDDIRELLQQVEQYKLLQMRTSSSQVVFDGFLRKFSSENQVKLCKNKVEFLKSISHYLEQLEETIFLKTKDLKIGIQRAFLDIGSMFIDEEKLSRAFEAGGQDYKFLLDVLQDYVNFCQSLEQERIKHEAEPLGRAVIHAKNIALQKVIMREEVGGSAQHSNAQEQKEVEQMAQRFLHEAWSRASIDEVFLRGWTYFGNLKRLLQTSKYNSVLLENVIRGEKGLFAVMSAVLAHKICEIFCDNNFEKITAEMYIKLYGEFRNNELRCFNKPSFDMASPEVGGKIYHEFDSISVEKVDEKVRQMFVLLMKYREFIREIRVQLDTYLTACGYTSDAGRPCTASFSSQAFDGIPAPALRLPYLLDGAKSEGSPQMFRGGVRMKRDEEVDPVTIPPIDFSSAPTISSMAWSSSSERDETESVSSRVAGSSYRSSNSFGSSSSSTSHVMPDTSVSVSVGSTSTVQPVAAPTVQTVSSVPSGTASVASSSAAPTNKAMATIVAAHKKTHHKKSASF